jgi:hypothetical protein
MIDGGVLANRSTVGGALVWATAGPPPIRLIPPRANVVVVTAASLKRSRLFMTILPFPPSPAGR